MSGGARFAPDGSDAAVAEALAAQVARPGRKRLILAGGATPAAVLARLGPGNWSDVDVWPSDERVLPRDAPPDHPASNRAALARLLRPLGATVHPLVAGAAPAQVDLAWVGMGTDGHVASIFPGMALPDDAPAGVVAVTPDPLPPEAPFPRLTLTMAALASVPRLWVVVRGAAKHHVLTHGDPALPIHRLLARAGPRATIFWSEA